MVIKYKDKTLAGYPPTEYTAGNGITISDDVISVADYDAFSKAGKYSEIETRVGTWTDGKPLYRVVWSFTAPAVSDGVYTTVHAKLENATVRMVQVFGNLFSGVVEPLPATNQDGLRIKYFYNNNAATMGGIPPGLAITNQNSNYVGKTLFAVVEYTKTNDAAEDQAAPLIENVYSTSETRVGTWIDGKPLYRKVFTATSPSTKNTIAHYQSISVPNWEVVGISGYVKEKYGQRFPVGGAFWGNQALQISTNTTGVWIVMFVDDFYSDGTNATNFLSVPVTLVVEYTKTTD